jgi:hypothetical protein
MLNLSERWRRCREWWSKTSKRGKRLLWRRGPPKIDHREEGPLILADLEREISFQGASVKVKLFGEKLHELLKDHFFLIRQTQQYAYPMVRNF